MRLITILTLLFLPLTLTSAELPIGNFSSGNLAGWETQPFKGLTSYRLTRDGERLALRAESHKSASGLIRKLPVDTAKYPLLRWSWKVEHLLLREDVTRKKGDDFAARVYVVFPRTFFWRMRAITYVWSSAMTKGSWAASPYTANSVIVAVESGKENLGEWLCEERNIRNDYRRFFGEDPPLLGAVAIMTDTDDTGDDAVAWYGDISLASAPTILSAPIN